MCKYIIFKAMIDNNISITPTNLSLLFKKSFNSNMKRLIISYSVFHVVNPSVTIQKVRFLISNSMIQMNF